VQYYHFFEAKGYERYLLEVTAPGAETFLTLSGHVSWDKRGSTAVEGSRREKFSVCKNLALKDET
jgi:hypothetical protein